MAKRKKPANKQKKTLDTDSAKRRRGRPGVIASTIWGRAENNRYIFNQVWPSLWPLLSKAQSDEEIVIAFEHGAGAYARQFAHFAPLILKILREKKFPKTAEAQANFMADSLAAFGDVTPRRSRDIAAEMRAKQKRRTEILRYEFWIECSCRYKGKSLHHACPKCGAQIRGGLFGW